MAKSDRLGKQSPRPRKIIIGDGSVRDLVYFLMGGDVTTKKGRKKVASSDVRNEVQSLVRYQMQGNSPFTPDYAAREARFNEVVERNRSKNLQRDHSPYTSPKPIVRSEAGERRPYGVLSSRPQQGTPNYVDREARFNEVVQRNRQPVPLMNKEYTNNPAILREGEYGNVDAYAGDPEFDIMMTPPGGGMAYGGPVRKRRKKRKYGGKMKKYAKGGGIRKPTYS